MSFESEIADSGEREVLRCLFFHGPTFDGDIPSKVARSSLHDRGLVTRNNGWNNLSAYGFEVCMRHGLDAEKEKWVNRRRSSAPGAPLAGRASPVMVYQMNHPDE